jgi:DNA-binding XRE family transcriptional regulator
MPQLAGLPLFKNLDTYRVIGENIKELRREVPATQLEFARYIGICNESLSKIEAGKNRTEYALIKSIADIFGITTDDLATKNSYQRIREQHSTMNRVRSLLNVII